MTFGSANSIAFAVVTLAACAALGRSRRWLVLLLASWAFLAAVGTPASLAVLLGVTLVSWRAAIAIEGAEGSRRRAVGLWGGVLAVVPGLAAVGLSYYALQAVAYLLDVRDGVVPAERHLGLHALALAFFPKVVQGPIERAEALLPQLRAPRALRLVDVAAGAQLVLWGLFQKRVVADRLAPFVDAAFSDVGHHAGLPLLVATWLFAAQIYFDFAGYTDVALGLGRAMGIRLAPNFASPYLARSVAEFWRRWHISLSSWLLDYVFKPLQLGLRDWRTWGTPVALVATFLVSGLWHGAAWTFLAWGLLHGLYLAVEALRRALPRRRPAPGPPRPLQAAAQVALTFHLVCLGWIFFRARTLPEALWAVRLLVQEFPATLARAASGQDLDALVYMGQGQGAFLAAVAAIAIGSALRAALRRAGVLAPWPEVVPAPAGLVGPFARTALASLLFYGVAVLGTSAQGFLYARF
jgi:alginate O-acetyltransferase complex protein AlgI